jgi:beta-lactamase regulating signal transducer with metallopeptidase domain
MNAVLWWLAQNTLTVALLFPIVAVACRLCRNRPAVAHMLWAVVLLKFVTPPVFFWPWPVPQFSAPLPSEPRATLSLGNQRLAFVSDDALVGSGARGETGNSSARSNSFPVDLLAGVESPANDHFLARLPLPLLAGALLVGVAVSVGLQAHRSARLVSLVRRGKRAPELLAREIESMAKQIGVRPPEALVSRDIVSPFMWCLGRLRLFWPEAMSSHGDIVRSRGVIVHELAHVRRGDHILAWVELFASFIWWWNPMYWFVRRRLRESAELACDAIAVSVAPDSRRDYAELLLELSSDSRCAALAPALGIKAGTASTFERRFSMIFSDRVSGRLPLWGFVAAGALAAAALPGWSAVPATESQSEALPGKIETAPAQLPGATAQRLEQIEAELKRLSVLLEAAKQSALSQPDQPADPNRLNAAGSWRGLKVIDKRPLSMSLNGAHRDYVVFTRDSSARVRATDKVGRLLWDRPLPRTLQLRSSSEWNISESLDQQLVILTWTSDGKTTTCHLDIHSGRLINEGIRASDLSQERDEAQLQLARIGNQIQHPPSLADRLRALNGNGSTYRSVVESLLKLEQTDHDLTQSIFQRLLQRDATPDEMAHAMKHLASSPSRRSAIEDIVWVLINSRVVPATPNAPAEL